MKEILTKLIGPVVDALEALAKSTENQIDDAAVRVLRVILESDLLAEWFLPSLLTDDPRRVYEAFENPEVSAELHKAGVSEEDFGAFCENVYEPLVGNLRNVPV